MKSRLRTIARGLALTTLALSSVSLADAQQTYVVDYFNGPGADFVQITDALVVASSGDTLEVRPSSPFAYSAFTVKTGLRILGGPGVLLQTQALGPSQAIRIQEVASGEVIVLKGLAEIPGAQVGGLLDVNSSGTSLHLEEVELLALTRLNIRASFQKCRLGSVDTSTSLLMTECIAAGASPPFLRTALEASGQTTIAGGDYTGAPEESGTAARPAIELIGTSTAFVTGDSSTTIRGGAATSAGAPAFLLRSSARLVLDPAPTLIPSLGVAPVQGAGQLTTTHVPYLRVDRLGNALTTTLATWPNAVVQLYVSPLTTPFSFAPSQPPVWIGNPVRVATDTVPANGISMNSFQLPALAPGSTFAMQALVISAGRIYLSNGVVTTAAD